MKRRKTLEILISPTTRCNLRCRYCYVDQNSSKSEADMTIEDIDAVYRWLSVFANIVKADRIRFTWFGGEPLLKGMGYLKSALSKQTQYFAGWIEVVNTMQSNLTLVTDDFIPLLKEYFHSSIGGSLDYKSPFRIFPNGVDSTGVIERNIRKLIESDIKVGIVCTATKRNINQHYEIYSYFKSLGTDFRVNRAAGVSANANSLSVGEYNTLIKSICDIYISDKSPTVEFFNFTMMARLFLTGRPVVCVDTKEPYFYLGFEARGRIMSRCRFTGCIGNYMVDPPEFFYEKMKKLSVAHSIPGRCRACEFYEKVCLGGCSGESNVDCFSSNCGYRTESTYDLWCYIRDFLSTNGHRYAELAEEF